MSSITQQLLRGLAGSKPQAKPQMSEYLSDRFQKDWDASENDPAKREVMKKIGAKLLEHFDPPIDKSDSPLNRIADAYTRGIDYGSGLYRTAAYAPATLATGTLTTQDLIDALKGRAPTAQEYMKRAGVGPGYSVADALPEGTITRGGPLDITTRGAVGSLADILASPAGIGMMKGPARALTGAAEREAQIPARVLHERLMDQINEPVKKNQALQALFLAADPQTPALAAAGKGLYKSAPALREADILASKGTPGLHQPSDVFLQANKVGTAGMLKTSKDQMLKEARDNVNRSIEDILSAAPDTSASLNDIRKPVNQFLENQLEKPGKTQAAEEAKKVMDKNFIAQQPNGALPMARQNEIDQMKKMLHETIRTGSEEEAQNAAQFLSALEAEFPNPELNLRDINDLKKTMQDKARTMAQYTRGQSRVQDAPAAGAAENRAIADLLGDTYGRQAHSAAIRTENLADAATQGFDPELAVGSLRPGAGGRIYRDNQIQKALLSGEEAINEAGNQSIGSAIKRGTIPTLVGGGLGVLPAYATHGQGLAPALTIGGTALTGAALSSNLGRTGIGLGLYRGAPLISSAVREGSIQNARKESPWSLLQPGRSPQSLKPEPQQTDIPSADELQQLLNLPNADMMMRGYEQAPPPKVPSGVYQPGSNPMEQNDNGPVEMTPQDFKKLPQRVQDQLKTQGRAPAGM